MLTLYSILKLFSSTSRVNGKEIRRGEYNFSLILILSNAGEVRCNVQYFSVVTRSSHHISQMVEFQNKIVR